MQKITSGKQTKALPSSKEVEETDVFTSLSSELALAASGDAANSSAIKDPESYFPAIRAQKLRTGILPYRVKKDFISGIFDLKKLMETGHQEGAFLFDPAQETWFSFGGRTNANAGRNVRHEFFPYDPAKLSSAPVFIHMHPEQSEVFIVPPRESLAYPQMQKRLTKFFAAMPSGADYKMCAAMLRESSEEIQLRSSIVTSMGLTEMTLPADIDAIESLGERFRDIKDQVMLEFDAHRYITGKSANESAFEFVQRMLVLVNKKLPAGFSITLHSYDHLIPKAEPVSYQKLKIS